MTLATADGTAIAGRDYEPKTKEIIFKQGTGRTCDFTVQTIDDRIVEAPIENLTVKFVSIMGGNPGSIGTGSIEDNDCAVIQLTSRTVIEGDSGVREETITVSTVDPQTGELIDVDGEVCVEVAARPGSAKIGEDFVAMPQKIHLGKEGNQKEYVFHIVGDTKFEHDEDFQVYVAKLATDRKVSVPSPDYHATVVIANDDKAPLLDVCVPDAVDEGDTLLVKLSLQGETELPGSVTVTIYGKNRAVVLQKQVTFSSVNQAAEVELPLADDQIVDFDRGLVVEVSDPVNLCLPDNTTWPVLIRENDTAEIFLAGPVSVVEGNTGTRTARFEVVLTGAVQGDVAFTTRTTDITATYGSDYTSQQQHVIQAGLDGVTMPTRQFVDVTIIGDTVREPDETFLLAIASVSAPPGLKISGDPVVGTIINDDRNRRCRDDDDDKDDRNKGRKGDDNRDHDDDDDSCRREHCDEVSCDPDHEDEDEDNHREDDDDEGDHDDDDRDDTHQADDSALVRIDDVFSVDSELILS